MCSEVLTKVEFDHIKPLSCGGSNLASNIQALCVACHRMKTGEEAGIHRSSWHSERSTDVHESLVADGKPLQLVFGDGVDKCFEMDVAKCRRWALEKAESPLPIVTITDCILPFGESQLAQASFFFIDAGLGIGRTTRIIARILDRDGITANLRSGLLIPRLKTDAANPLQLCISLHPSQVETTSQQPRLQILTDS